MASPGIGKIEKTKALHSLGVLCGNSLAALDTVVEVGGVRIVSAFLSDDSAQVRKYSASVLSDLAGSVRGLVAIAEGGLLPSVVALLKDPMPNVSSAACTCLFRISQRYTGCLALSSTGIAPILFDLLCSDVANLNMRTLAAKTLVGMYRFCPLLERPDTNRLMQQLVSPDRRLTYQVLMLLDLFGVPVQPLGPSGELDEVFGMLASDDRDLKTEGASRLLTLLTTAPHHVPEFIELMGLDLLLENQRASSSDSKLSRLAYACYAVLVDCTTGARCIARLGIIDLALESLGGRNPLYLFAVARFIEVACQQHATSSRVVLKQGVEAISGFVQEHWDKQDLNTLCLPALGALTHLAVSQPDARAAIAPEADKLASLVGASGSGSSSSAGAGSSGTGRGDAAAAPEVADEIRTLVSSLQALAKAPPSENLRKEFALKEAQEKK